MNATTSNATERQPYEAPALARQNDWDVTTGSPATSQWVIK